MKASAFALLSMCAFSGFGIEVAALPTSEFWDMEVSTNFTFAVGEGSNRRLVFSLELEATPTNNVEEHSAAADELRLGAGAQTLTTRGQRFPKSSITSVTWHLPKEGVF